MPDRTSRRRKLSFAHQTRFFAFLFGCLLVAISLGLFAQETHRVLAEPRTETVLGEKPLRIWFFDVGQGDATFIELPTGEQILIDGGRDQTVLTKLGSVMWPWDRSIDVVIPTHPDADHITGLTPVLERYDVGSVFTSGALAHTQVDERLQEAIQLEEADVVLVSRASVFTFGDVTFDVLWPAAAHEGEYVEDRNDESVVVLLTYGDTTVLLTGDTEAGAEAAFGRDAGDVDVLKAGHHGSRTSSAEAFLQNVLPEYAIISAGAENRYGHPHPVVLDRLFRIGAQVFRTDLDGDILLQSWGGEPKVSPAPLPF